MTPLLAAIRAPLPILQMTGETRLSPDHDKIVEPACCRRSRPDRQGRSRARARTLCPICTRLSIIVPGADHRIVSGSAVDRRIGADIDIVADHDPPELRHLDRAVADRARSRTRPGRSARPGCSTTREPIRQWLSVTLAPIRQSSPSSTPAAITVLAPTRQRRPSRAPGLDHDIRPDVAILRDDRRRIDDAPTAPGARRHGGGG